MPEDYAFTLISDDTLAIAKQGVIELAEFGVGTDRIGKGGVWNK